MPSNEPLELYKKLMEVPHYPAINLRKENVRVVKVGRKKVIMYETAWGKKRKALKASRTKKKVKSKQVPLSRLKSRLDAVFSLYVRAKYPKTCYTCGAAGKTLQCGHFVSRSYLSTRWNESNCRPQCVGCNIWGRGKPLDFEENLKKELGDVAVEQLKSQRHILIRPTRGFYEDMIKLYSSMLSSLHAES